MPIRPTTASRRTSSREIRLVTLPLRVREVIALVVVQGKAQLAFICSQMVLHKVRILKGGGRRGEGGARREKGGGTKGEGLTRERWRTWRQRWSTSTTFLVVIDVSPSTSYATHKTYPMQHHKHRHHIISQHASQVLRPQPPSVNSPSPNQSSPWPTPAVARAARWPHSAPRPHHPPRASTQRGSAYPW